MGARRIALPDGRHLVLDDVGPLDGAAVAYLHGMPDGRTSRHPDDALAGAAGVRLLAVDRPGTGESSPDPGATHTSLGADLAAVLDELAIDRVRLLGWSSGGLAALGVATVLGPRVAALTLVAPVPPAEALQDPDVLAHLGPTRRPLAELVAELGPVEVAAETAPYLVPQPLSAALALEHVLDGAGERGRAELATVPGAAEGLALGLQAAVAHGLGALEQDLRLQLSPGLAPLLGEISAPVRTVHGEHDGVSPPAVGRWLAERLPHGTVEEVPGAAHHLHFPHWARLLTELAGRG